MNTGATWSDLLISDKSSLFHAIKHLWVVIAWWWWLGNTPTAWQLCNWWTDSQGHELAVSHLYCIWENSNYVNLCLALPQAYLIHMWQSRVSLAGCRKHWFFAEGMWMLLPCWTPAGLAVIMLADFRWCFLDLWGALMSCCESWLFLTIFLMISKAL